MFLVAVEDPVYSIVTFDAGGPPPVLRLLLDGEETVEELLY